MFWSILYFLSLMPSIIGLIQIHNLEIKKDTNDYNDHDEIKIYIVLVSILDLFITFWLILNLALLMVIVLDSNSKLPSPGFYYSIVLLIILIIFKFLNILFISISKTFKNKFNNESLFNQKSKKIIFNLLFLLPLVNVIWLFIILVPIIKEEGIWK
ncbi:hypothetical protein MENTO_v1c03590 [Mesoplasma entomophilum]|uniref:Uncharacterized protein n=1 Tax=Mesoplasma entomophilum TaxID=2149 RepID=A0A3S5XZC5_9MOLU|nr:hypothetical protein [Mesoplasma entomophilum]ATQ35505.1 hypothetical protein CS528_01850 [Mesoplasma entomophilum]ATZ19465.1 hypothetical protein MENTO_v1c03590 [Mesoplasma entomophilum]